MLRRRLSRPGARVTRIGPLRIDHAAREVRVGDAEIPLPAMEYRLLVHLAAEPTRIFTKDELLREVWGFRSRGRTRTLDSHACRLRRKLSDAGDARFVENIWGTGYRLLAPGAQRERTA